MPQGVGVQIPPSPLHNGVTNRALTRLEVGREDQSAQIRSKAIRLNIENVLLDLWHGTGAVIQRSSLDHAHPICLLGF